MLIIEIILIVVLLFVGIIAWRTYMFSTAPVPVERVKLPEVDSAAIAQHLARAIQCQTVSVTDDQTEAFAPFEALQNHLKITYPHAHAAMNIHTINQWSLVFEWQGTIAELPPVVFMAHQDVVPVPETTLDQWTYPPFSGEIADGFVWGRGTLDIKSQLIGLMEAAEYLAKQNYQPQRTLYFTFGHDEEIEGKRGTKAIVQWFKEQGIRPAAVLDEGSVVVEDTLPGVQSPVAVVGVAEKRHTCIQIEVKTQPGHASMPPRDTAIILLARALARIDAHPQPATLNYVYLLFRHLGQHAPLSQRVAFANLWLLGPLVRRKLATSPQTNALIRTTTTPTIITGGQTQNVLPHKATVTFDCRLMPDDTPEKLAQKLKRIIADERLTVTVVTTGLASASRLSSWETREFNALRQTIQQVFGDFPVLPYLTAGASDARYFTEICDAVYRFTPIHLHASDLERIHGINERLSIKNLENMGQFYIQLIPIWGASD